MLWEQLVAEQESSANLVEQVDELKRKTEKTEREFEEFKIQQQEEYNKLRDDIMRFSSSSDNSQSSTLLAWCSEFLWFDVCTRVLVWCAEIVSGLLLMCK